MVIFKIMGAMLILTSSTMTGLHYARRIKDRLSALNEMKKAMELLKGEVSFSLSPFGEAALSIGERVLPPVKGIFIKAGTEALSKNHPDIYSIWEGALTEAEAAFTKEDINAFTALGKNLGYLDRDMQIKSIDLVLVYIEDTINKINEDEGKQSRLYKSLGVLCGLLIIVLMF